MQTDNNVVVVGNLKYAGFWIRVVAIIVDIIVISIPLGIIAFFLGIAYAASGGTDPTVLTRNGILPWVIILIEWIYFITMTSTTGATLGKMLVGITVKSANGQKLSLGQIILRETVGRIIAGIILCIGYIAVAFTARKQGVHDMIAKTVVVYKDPSKKNNKGLIVGIILVALVLLLPLISIIGFVSILKNSRSSYPYTVPPLSQNSVSTTTSDWQSTLQQNTTTTTPQSTHTPVMTTGATINQPQTTTTAPDNFTIDFPGQPTHTAQTLTSPYQHLPIQVDLYQYDGSDTLNYIVGHFQYSSDIDVSVPQNNLQGVMNGVLKTIKGAVIATSTFETFGKYPALSYELYSSETGTYSYNKAILIGNQLYEIAVNYQGTTPTNISEFINSFQLK